MARVMQSFDFFYALGFGLACGVQNHAQILGLPWPWTRGFHHNSVFAHKFLRACCWRHLFDDLLPLFKE